LKREEISPISKGSTQNEVEGEGLEFKYIKNFNLINKFVDAGILKEANPKQKRNKVYVFNKLMKILNKV
jgi:hypothetical protein